jgi:cell division protein FtsQ
MANRTQPRSERTPVRKDKRTIEWQQWFGRSLVLLFILGIISSGVYLKQVDTLPILHVTVDGKFNHINKEALVKSVTPHAKGGFMSIDVAKIRQAGEALAWVKVVQVKRIWPDSLHLIVEEQTAIAQWGNEALINKQGHLFFPVKTSFPNGLVQLKGPRGTNQLLAKRFYEVRQLAASIGMSVQKIEMNARRAWSIKLNNGLKVMLGRHQSEQRLQRFANVFTTVLQPYKNDITAVDMRYTNGLSVAWAAGQKPDFSGTI